MKLFLRLLVLLPLVTPLIARAQPAAAPTSVAIPPVAPADITPAQAQGALEVLRDDKKRAQLIETLETIAKASPAPAATPAAAASGVAKAPAAAPPTATTPKIVVAPANGLGRQLVGQATDWADRLAGQFGAAATAITDFPLLWRWALGSLEDETARAWLLNMLWKLAVVLACGLSAEWVLSWLLRRPYRELERHAPQASAISADIESPDESAVIADHDAGRDQQADPDREAVRAPPRRHGRLSGAWLVVRRLPFAVAGLLIQLIPIAGFAIVANPLSAAMIHNSFGHTRLAILAVVNAYVVLKIIMCLTRMLASDQHPGLAVIRMKPENAAYIEVWVRRIAVLALFGIAAVEAAGALGLAAPAKQALLKLVALVVHICFVIIVLQCRRGVADAIRAPEGTHGGFAAFRDRLAAVWHYLAAALILALWVIWAIQVRDGLATLLRLIVLTVLVVGVGRLVSVVALGSLDRLFHLHPQVSARYPGLEARANRYYPLLRGMISAFVWLATIVALLEAWGLSAFSWFGRGRTGDKLISAMITVGVAIIVAIVIWEIANAAMDRHMARLTREQQGARVARVKTLLPILRNLLLIAIVVILGLTVLNQIGVNIAPLLAGAGIVGVALGFGSQKLVQDLITGLFLLLENAMQVGDWVTAGGLSGSVETLSIRTMRLRAGDGSLHIIPFSAVTTVTNTNRGVGNAAVSVNVALKEDPDRVGDVLKDIAAGMRADPKFAPAMQSDLQLWGVDKVDASVMTIVGQIVCTDSGRWSVQREFNRRLKIRFQELGIEIANPTHTIVVARPEFPAAALEHAGSNPPEPETDATTAPDSPPPAALGHGE